MKIEEAVTRCAASAPTSSIFIALASPKASPAGQVFMRGHPARSASKPNQKTTMKTKRKNSRSKSIKKTPRLDIYERVTARILEQLEKGEVPWKSPHVARVGFPHNFSSSRPYQGINVVLLAMARFVSPHFLTYLQAQDLGGQVRKGERGFLVVKYGEYKKKNDSNSTEETETRGYLKGYTVFNACQIEGIDFPEVTKPAFTPSQQVERARQIVATFPKGPEIREGRGTRTCYNRKNDCIDIPDRAFFDTEERFYESLFHEMIHATGAAHRLARPTLLKSAGIDAVGEARQHYGKEELVAEIGASFLASHAGITMDGHEQNAAYLQSWLQVLKVKENKRWIIEAASQAQKAVSFILEGPKLPFSQES